MLKQAFVEMVSGLSRFEEAVSYLEKELKETHDTIALLQAKISYLENTQQHHHSVLEDLTKNGIPSPLTEDDLDERIRDVTKIVIDEVFDDVLDDKVRDAVDLVLDDKVDDAVESALAGRMVEVTLSGNVTL
jgi:FtsZ-binding cell division protein ZapB